MRCARARRDAISYTAAVTVRSGSPRRPSEGQVFWREARFLGVAFCFFGEVHHFGRFRVVGMSSAFARHGYAKEPGRAKSGGLAPSPTKTRKVSSTGAISVSGAGQVMMRFRSSRSGLDISCMPALPHLCCPFRRYHIWLFTRTTRCSKARLPVVGISLFPLPELLGIRLGSIHYLF